MAAPLCAFALVAAACGDDDDGASDTTATTAAEADGTTDTTASDGGGSVLWDNGDCDASLETYPIGIITTFESPVISLVNQVHALEASVEAFNARGGVGGHCIELTTCDSNADPNQEVDCARQMVDGGIVATINDSTVVNGAGVLEVMEPAGLPRVAISPGVPESGSPLTYTTGAGSTGNTFMMVPPLARRGLTKFAMVHIDSPQISGLIGAMGGMLAAYGAELVLTSPVPAGTTDFQQFVLAAEGAGAEAVIIALGPGDALRLLQAAQQLDSQLIYSASLGNFSLNQVRGLDDFADRIVLNSELPPITGDTDIWPVLDEAIADLDASGESDLQRDEILTNAFRSWVGVYSLVRVVEDFGDPDDVSREAITAAFEAAHDVDMLGLIPPWTPGGGSGQGPFGSISQPWYYIVEFDPDLDEFVVQAEQLNVLLELAGQTEYEPQPVAG